MSRWYQKSGTEGDVVISTRIRLARNLREYPFPVRMNDAQREVFYKVLALIAGNLHSICKDGIKEE